jgi:hypothetical protein
VIEIWSRPLSVLFGESGPHTEKIPPTQGFGVSRLVHPLPQRICHWALRIYRGDLIFCAELDSMDNAPGKNCIFLGEVMFSS